ncbi:A-factor biosynthesis hotdog domain protein [mine drainage metagenome]|uniref:A-factor biosynthesis hotdog domain protein n=1 Tax=mine drainage metagenome TaxID=410659 RepID=A0A1J5RG81_9ZZZZ
MSKATTVLLVGDRFERFGALDGAITVSDLANLLDGKATGETIPRHISLGQGVSESWWLYIKNRALARGLGIIFSGIELLHQRSGRRICHKSQRRNVLITDPEPVDENCYRLLLSIDDECEIMSDHVTGHHIQGMVLIEAARQSFIATTELFLLPKAERYYFVINKLDTSFLKFAFPVATEIYCLVKDLDLSRDDRIKAKAQISFTQGEENICKVDVEYTAILENKLSGKELQLATACLERELDTVAIEGVSITA